MTYVAGTTGLGRLGIPDNAPRVRCDHEGGCDRLVTLKSDRVPPTWFLEGRSPPTWSGVRGLGWRLDYCPDHKKAPMTDVEKAEMRKLYERGGR